MNALFSLVFLYYVNPYFFFLYLKPHTFHLISSIYLCYQSSVGSLMFNPSYCQIDLELYFLKYVTVLNFYIVEYYFLGLYLKLVLTRSTNMVLRIEPNELLP